ASPFGHAPETAQTELDLELRQENLGRRGTFGRGGLERFPDQSGALPSKFALLMTPTIFMLLSSRNVISAMVPEIGD
ncbi:MAG: hypothetical protein ACM3ZC_13670, partial [Bacteroidota bacterium]